MNTWSQSFNLSEWAAGFFGHVVPEKQIIQIFHTSDPSVNLFTIEYSMPRQQLNEDGYFRVDYSFHLKNLGKNKALFEKLSGQTIYSIYRLEDALNSTYNIYNVSPIQSFVREQFVQLAKSQIVTIAKEVREKMELLEFLTQISLRNG